MLKRNITSLLNAANEPFASLAEDAIKRLAKEMTRERDEVIKQAFIKNNLPTDDDFIKNHCSLIIQEGADFDHCWYNYGKPDAIRIISIQREPQVSMTEVGGSYKMKAEHNYY